MRSLRFGYKKCAVIPVAGQRTQGTCFRALKVTPQMAAPGAESAVYDCLVLWLRTVHCYNPSGLWLGLVVATAYWPLVLRLALTSYVSNADSGR